MRKKRKDYEIRFYEGLVAKRPNFFQALATLGDAYTNKGFYVEGLDVDRKLAVLRPSDEIVRYNLACSLSLTGKLNEALSEIKKAVLLGYDDFEYLLKDEDLKNLRQMPGFKTFLQKLQRTAK
jgi:tetratricopeptide (TPR) repeat protein